jgi:hypothetical protein
MSIADLSTVLKIFSETKLDDELQDELFAEALLMTLARASSSDANIHAVEVESIQQIMLRETGTEVSTQDVRKAARTELYESAPLKRYLGSVRRGPAHDSRSACGAERRLIATGPTHSVSLICHLA